MAESSVTGDSDVIDLYLIISNQMASGVAVAVKRATVTVARRVSLSG